MDLGHGMIQNPAAEVTEVVDYLIACERTLASLYTLADCLISWQVSRVCHTEKCIPQECILSSAKAEFAHYLNGLDPCGIRGGTCD